MTYIYFIKINKNKIFQNKNINKRSLKQKNKKLICEYNNNLNFNKVILSNFLFYILYPFLNSKIFNKL